MRLKKDKAKIKSQRTNIGRIILAAFLLLAAPIAFADTLTGKVVKVTDGDTITVLDSTNTQHRIRFVWAAVAIGFRFPNLSL